VGGLTIDGMEVALKAKEALSSKKGENIVLLDVREVSSVTDYYVIATGANTPHLKALFQAVEQRLKAGGAACYRKTGNPESGWLVADYVDAVVHLFSRELRAYYALEALWSDAEVVG